MPDVIGLGYINWHQEALADIKSLYPESYLDSIHCVPIEIILDMPADHILSDQEPTVHLVTDQELSKLKQGNRRVIDATTFVEAQAACALSGMYRIQPGDFIVNLDKEVVWKFEMGRLFEPECIQTLLGHYSIGFLKLMLMLAARGVVSHFGVENRSGDKSIIFCVSEKVGEISDLIEFVDDLTQQMTQLWQIILYPPDSQL